MAGLDFSQGHHPDAQRNLFLFICISSPWPRYPRWEACQVNSSGCPQEVPSQWECPRPDEDCSATCNTPQGLRGPEKASGPGSQGIAQPLSELGQADSSSHLVFLINRTKELYQMGVHFISSQFRFSFLAHSRDSFLPPLSLWVDSEALLPILLTYRFIYTRCWVSTRVGAVVRLGKKSLASWDSQFVPTGKNA